KNIIYVLIFLIMGFLGCQKESKSVDAFQNINPIKNIYAQMVNHSNKFYPLESEPFGDTITIYFPYFYSENSDNKVNLSLINLDITLNEGIRFVDSTFNSTKVIDLNHPFDLEVYNIDGSKETVVIAGKILLNDEAEILNFSLPNVGLTG